MTTTDKNETSSDKYEPSIEKNGPTADTDKSETCTETPKAKKHDMLDIIGGDGSWQRRIFFTLLFIAIPCAAQSLAITFMAPDIDYWCVRSEDVKNLSVEEWKSLLPTDDKHCSRYENFNFNASEKPLDLKAIPCEDWEYDKSFYSSTILSEWNLVCDREWLVSLSKSLYMLGMMVSTVGTGILSDKVGRRSTFISACFVMAISSTLAAFSTSYAMYIASRFFVAMSVGAYYNSLYVMLMEVLDPDKRMLYGTIVQLGWCTGFVVLPGVAWLIRDWFWIQIALTVPCLPYLVIWRMIPESPRWLLSQGRIAEAKEILIKGAKTNGKEISDIEIQLEKVLAEASEDFESGETEGSFLDLMRTPVLRRTTLIIFFAWFVVSFIYFGLSFNTNELAGDPFLNFSLFGLVEYPAYLSAYGMNRYFGRKKPAGCSIFVGGIFCLASYFVQKGGGWPSVAVPLFGKFFVTICYVIIILLTSELLPTVVRNTGLGWACFFEQIGSIIAPFVHELGMYAGQFVPSAIFGLLGVASGSLILLLPETGNLAIPDTFGEAAEVSRKNNANMPKILKSMDSAKDIKDEKV